MQQTCLVLFFIIIIGFDVQTFLYFFLIQMCHWIHYEKSCQRSRRLISPEAGVTRQRSCTGRRNLKRFNEVYCTLKIALHTTIKQQ